MKKIIAVMLAFIIVILSASPVYAGESSRKKCNELVRLTNEFRTSDTWYWKSDGTKKYVSGLKALKYDTELEKFAMKRAKEISKNYSHENARTCAMLEEQGYYCDETGENLCISTSKPKHVLQNWIEEKNDYFSQSNRRAILNSRYNYVAVGYYNCDGVYYWAMLFAHKPEQKKSKLKFKTVTPGKASIHMTWSRVDGISCYEIHISTSKSFESDRTIKYMTKKKTTNGLQISNLASNKKYYIRIRTVKNDSDGKKKYSKWVNYKKAVKTK